MGSTASAHTSNTALTYTAHIQHNDFYCQKNSTTASSNIVEVQKVSSITMNTQGGTPEISFVGSDLYDYNATAFGYSPYISAQSTTNQGVQAFSLPWYYSPYPNDPTEPYGIQPLQLNQVTVNWAADGSVTFNTYTYDLYFEGVSPKATNGYLVGVTDKETLAVGGLTWTKAFGKNLMGVMYPATAFIDDLSAGSAPNTTDVRTTAVANSRNIIYGPLPPMKAYATAYWPPVTSSPPVLLDDGSFFVNFGMHNNTGNGGININGQTQIEVQTVGGTTNTINIYPIVLR